MEGEVIACEVGIQVGVIWVNEGCRWEAVLVVFDWVIMACWEWSNAWCVMATVGCVVNGGWRVKD